MSGAGERPARGGRSTRQRAPRPTGKRGPFQLKVRSLRSRSGTRQDVHLAGVIPDLSVSDSEVPAGAEVRFDGWVESTLGGVTIAGRVTAPWSGTCRRCLEPATGVLEAEVRELCRDPRDTAAEASGDSADGDEAYPVGSDELDVEPIVRDACILELPLAPLCAESCLGLCPTCGTNRNRDQCSCDAPIDQRWSALAGIGSDPADRADQPEHTQAEHEAE